MKLYVIGDTHFNHDNMVEYCNRPENFDERIGKALCRLAPDDTLYHLGDICIGRDAEMHEKFIEPTKAKKILVRGNHDKRSNNWYLRHGWDFVCTTITDKFFNTEVLLSHRPMRDNGYELNIHAHLHNLGHRDGEYLLTKNEKQILYAVEDYDYIPMTIEFLINKWRKGKI